MFNVTTSDLINQFDDSSKVVSRKSRIATNISDILPDELDYLCSSDCYYDLLTILKKGPSWAFELLKQDFPKTHNVLVNQAKTFLLITYTNPKTYTCFIDVGGRLIRLNRESLGYNPSDEGYVPKLDIAIKAIPKTIVKGFYTRFSGMSLIRDLDGIALQTNMLPLPRGFWRPLSELSERHELNDETISKKFEVRFPIENQTTDAHNFFFMSAFLSTYIDNYEEPDARYAGDYFFVKHHIHDHEIYHVKDGDYENMRILNDYSSAIYGYCEHVLLVKEGRFDFVPYTTSFSW